MSTFFDVPNSTVRSWIPPKNSLRVAPMIQWTDQNFRYYIRGITKNTILYTEMTMAKTLTYNPHCLHKFIAHDTTEHPLVLQLGGNDPEILGKACELVHT